MLLVDRSGARGYVEAVVDCSNKKMTSVKLFVDGKQVKEGKITSPEREPLGRDSIDG